MQKITLRGLSLSDCSMDLKFERSKYVCPLILLPLRHICGQHAFEKVLMSSQVIRTASLKTLDI